MASYFLSANRESYQEEPYLFQMKNGNIIGLWDDAYPDPGAGGNTGVYARTWASDLSAASNTDSRIPNLTEDLQRSAAGTSFSNGNFAVIFESRGPSAINGQDDAYEDSYIKFFKSNGTALGPARQLTPNTQDDHYTVDIVTLKGGHSITLIAEYEFGGHFNLLAYKHNANGQQIGRPVTLTHDAEVFVNPLSGPGYIAPSLTTTASGGYAVSWHEKTIQDGMQGYTVKAKVFTSDGRALGPERTVAPLIPFENGRSELEQSDSEIVGRSIGGFAIAWTREEEDIGSETDLYLRILDRTGVGVTRPVMVNSDHRLGEQVLQDVLDLGAGKTLVTYFNQIPDAIDDFYDGGVLMGRVFGSTGKALTKSFTISENNPYDEMGGGNTIINIHGQIVSTFHTELTYENMDDVIITSRSLTLPTVQGTRGSDGLSGTLVNDRIYGNGGNDRIYGAAGNDTLNGGSGNDRVSGGRGNDVLEGSTGHDRVAGESGNDRLLGGSGNDTIYGGTGHDRIAGGDDNDKLYGDSGNDILWGHAGSDRLRGGAGNDTFYGGSGSDIFIFGRGSDRDTIADFQDDRDTIALKNSVDSFSEAKSYAKQVGRDVVFDFGGGDVLTVRGVRINDLADDMIFG